jgi:hypothetical protein
VALDASILIETPADALEYYRARLVGEHPIICRGVRVVVRFNPEEIHLFTEDIKPGLSPRADMLVQRPGAVGEVRYFSKVRARMLDRILPTIAAPARALEAKIHRGVQLIGPVDPVAHDRLSVVVGVDGACWFVRTAYPLTHTEFQRYLRSRAAPWPPK